MERFSREMKHDGQSTQRPRISSPTRLAGMLVAAGNAGRADILHRSLELIDQSADTNIRGILLILLAQFVRLNDIKALQHLIERLAVIDEQGEAVMAQRAEHVQTGPVKDKETASDVDDVLYALHEEMEEEGSTLLARPYAYYGAYRALLAEHARTQDVPAIIHTLDMLSRSATKADASMRALVRGVLEKVGVRPFLTAIQRRPQCPAGDTTTPTTPTPQRSDSAYQPRPDTLGFLVRCMTAMLSEGTLTPQVLPDAYRLATLATQLLKKSAGHGASDFGVYRSLLQFYRASGVKPAIEVLLTQFDQHQVVVTPAIMDLALPGLRLAQLDRVFKALREKKNPAKPSPAHYMRIAQAIHFQETIPDFLNIFVGNYNVDHPGRGIEVFVLNRALLSYCKALHLGKATAIFNLMHPHTTRLSYSTHTEGLPEPLCEPDDDTYVIYMNLLEKIADLSRKGQVNYIKEPIPSQEEVLELAKQAYGMALKTMMIPPYDVFARMLSLYVGAKQIGRADVVFSQMKEAGHDPKPEHYRQLIEGFRSVDNKSAAQNLQREMQRRAQ